MPMQHDEQDIIWAAGFFDGAVTVNPWSLVKKTKEGGTKRYHYFRLSSSSTERGPLVRLHSMFGGTIVERSMKGKRGNKPVYDWRVTGQDAEDALFAVKAFMVNPSKLARYAEWQALRSSNSGLMDQGEPEEVRDDAWYEAHPNIVRPENIPAEIQNEELEGLAEAMTPDEPAKPKRTRKTKGKGADAPAA